MSILITGAGGFVGHHLIEYLEKQDETDIHGTVFLDTEKLALPEENIHKLNLVDRNNVYDVLNKVKPTEIYHLAAQSSVGVSWAKPLETIMTNIVGTVNLFECIKELGLKCRVLIIGSSEQYGEVPVEMLPIKETYDTNASNPYAITKKTQEDFAKLYCENENIEIIFVRAFNHIGPGQNEKFVVSNWLHQIVAMENSTEDHILKVGNINVKRDFTDVRDIVRGYYLLMQKGNSGEVYNIGSGNSITLSELLNVMTECSALDDIKIEVDESRLRTNDVADIRCDNSKIFNDIGWKPEIAIKTSIQDAITFIKNYE